MCRWLAYTGSSIPLEALLFKPRHSLIAQSINSSAPASPTNGDGFGIGWYGRLEAPGLFRSVRPAWNDFNLRELAAHIEAPHFLAHVRAASLATVQESNCHPFRFGDWLFVHNGEIAQVELFRRDLTLAIAPEFFNFIQGTTDSELMFYLCLTFGLENDPLGAIERMAGFVEQVGREHGVADCLCMTLGVSNRQHIYVVRYASDGDAPTLFHSRDKEDLHRLDSDLHGRVSLETRVIVSEPVSDRIRDWVSIPQGTALVVHKGDVTRTPFQPSLPNQSMSKRLPGAKSEKRPPT